MGSGLGPSGRPGMTEERISAMKLTNDKAITLLAALGQLDGYDRVVKQPDGSERVIRQHYRINPAARLAMARAIVALKPVADAYAAARDGMLMEHSEGRGALGDTPADAAKVIAFKRG